jgi:hypothetical protein
MTQITSIKLGVIVMCVATVPWSLAQRPRTATNGSNQTGVTTPRIDGTQRLERQLHQRRPTWQKSPESYD